MAKAVSKKEEATKSTGLVDWKAELGKYAKEAVATSVLGEGNKITVDHGILMYKGKVIEGGKFNAVILASSVVRAYYDKPWDPKAIVPPACFGIGNPPAGPHENAQAPQHETCKGCPLDAFGTASIGKGKACKEKRRLALIAEGDLEDLGAAEIATIEVSVTNTKFFEKYVADLQEAHDIPPFAAVTQIKVTPGGPNQFTFDFRLVSLIEDPAKLQVLVALYEKSKVEAERPFAKVAEPEPQTPAKARKF